ncbi:DUF502 domain-containing protein [Helicobacter cetorum]|uniref:DUF502 domain-containing protein n=1 Tax=Helicobacter cetorum TaxID=138563 RepID=UPI000CF1271D|nr:DUF502 domain-containing protein [Helicobacter cetorum]
MNTILRLMGKGILVLLPIIILLWLLSFVYGFVKNFIEIIFNTTANSLSATMGILFLSALLLVYVGRLFEKNKEFLLIKASEYIISKIPIVGSIYSALKDVVAIFSGKNGVEYLGVVYVEFGGSEVIGFITKKEEDESCWVFIPTTPNPISGLLLKIPKEKIKMTDMSVSQGLRKVISLGIK